MNIGMKSIAFIVPWGGGAPDIFLIVAGVM